jgi:hypothetical protein
MESQKNVFFVSPTLSPYGNTDRGARGASMFKFGVNPAVLVSLALDVAGLSFGTCLSYVQLVIYILF